MLARTLSSEERVGFLSGRVLAPVVDRATRQLDEKNPYGDSGRSWSYDWCRFRRDRACFYPEKLDETGTGEAGYAVWIPLYRGVCPRDKWEQQQACPVAEPGPKSGDPHALVDATLPWNEGGQRPSR